MGVPGEVRLEAREGGQTGEARLAGRREAAVPAEAVRPPLRRSGAAPGKLLLLIVSLLSVPVFSDVMLLLLLLVFSCFASLSNVFRSPGAVPCWGFWRTTPSVVENSSLSSRSRGRGTDAVVLNLSFFRCLRRPYTARSAGTRG